jgi:hypothetical protein
MPIQRKIEFKLFWYYFNKFFSSEIHPIHFLIKWLIVLLKKKLIRSNEIQNIIRINHIWEIFLWILRDKNELMRLIYFSGQTNENNRNFYSEKKNFPILKIIFILISQSFNGTYMMILFSHHKERKSQFEVNERIMTFHLLFCFIVYSLSLIHYHFV